MYALKEHSIWTARSAERILYENRFQLSEKLSDSMKILTIAGASFHDFGKDDTIYEARYSHKQMHDIHGYYSLLHSECYVNPYLLHFCELFQDYFNIDLIYYFAYISKYHKLLGQVNMKKISPKQYIQTIITELQSMMILSEIIDFIYSLLIILNADVEGARPSSVYFISQFI